ncbi:undecaprenyl-phosphate glucose phosphotransferase [Lacihabitans lacunae]|jgi:putative colanic acid biosysnthesis UDP-glucose lipid carrier transferase|uniref:Undecaprenyl-phosphate glucose phosphotransferase n=1 Tax=Lacihabitans lacunae TaxID=1028214 RepID=A0ABV7YTQ2_9BACT
MFKHFNKIGYLRFFTDLVLLTISFLVASIASKRGIHYQDRFIFTGFIIGWYLSTKISNAYDEFRTETFVGEMLVLLENVLVQIIIAGQLYFLFNSHEFARTFLAYYISIFSISILCKSYILKKALLWYRIKGGNTRNVIIIGYNDITKKIVEQILNNPHYGYKLEGIVTRDLTEVNDMPYLGTLDVFFDKYKRRRIDDFIITSDRLSHDMLKEIILYADQKAIRTKVVPNFHKLYQNRFELQTFAGYPLIAVRGEPLQELHWRYLKRFFDITFSIILCIILFSWLFPIIALLIKFDSKGPVFFKQDRWGQNGRKFKCIKFRSMKMESKDVTENGKFNQAKENDPRITKLGAFLRKSSIDELPQFINVLLNNMSVVGPRPHAHEHNLRTFNVIDKYMIRHWVKPGITGWAQVNGFRGETKTNDMMQKRVDLDIWYIENWTFWLDIKIVIITVYNAIKGEENAY